MEPSRDGADLCSLCRQLDFQLLLGARSNETVPDGRTSNPTILETVSLGSVEELHKRSSCIFCSMVFERLQTLTLDDIVPLEKDGQEVICYLNKIVRDRAGLQLDTSTIKDASEPSAFQLLITTKPALVDPYEEESLKILPPPPLIQRLLEKPASENCCYGRKLPSYGIDFNLLSHWTKICAMKTIEESQRSVNLASTKKSKVSLRLIDVDYQCLTERIEGPEYIALSYMWGKVTPFTLIQTNLTNLQKPGALSADDSKIPQTIRDAMTVCKRLGERFLWVDGLCIIQDAQDKLDEIGQMDKIYQQAKMTIVAAHGTDSAAGLPGVRPGSRTHSQHIIDLQGMELSNVLPGLGHAVNTSHWNTRAWTYQERLLSNKKLYFCKDQVFFECEHGEYWEDIFIDPHHNPRVQNIAYDADPNYGTPHKIIYRNKLNLHIYEEIVFEYTSRNLSYEEDILNAFQGVANVLTRDFFNNSPFVFGIPLCLLDVALLWYPTGPLQRRKRASSDTSHFPSWSWAGWVGRFEYEWYGNVSEKTASQIEWLRADGSDTPIQGYLNGMPEPSWPHWKLWKRHVDEGQFMYYTKKDGDPERWFCHPIPDLIENQPILVDFRTGQLHLRARLAKFTVTGQHSGRWCQSPTCDEGVHEKCELSIFDADDVRAGIVTLDGNAFQSMVPGLHDFICLSQSTLSHADSDPAWDKESEGYAGEKGAPPLRPRPPLDAEDEPFDQERYDPNICWCLYNVMMITWEDGIAYRVGIGQMHIHAFDKALPELQKILLG